MFPRRAGAAAFLGLVSLGCSESSAGGPGDAGSTDGSPVGTGGGRSVLGGMLGSGGRAPGAGSGGGSNREPTGLRVAGNRLVRPDGEPFHGRGANFNDTRSCDACSFQEPDVQGLNRWADELLDRWKANFVRFNLTAFPSSQGRVQWRSVTEDPQYLADVKNTVTHMTSKPGVYVMVTVFLDPSMKDNNGDYDSEWPTAETIPVYETLAETFAEDPKVLFGLTNEPHGPENRNPELAQRYLNSIDAIRAVEAREGVPEHVVVVQAPQNWARYLDYFVENPIDRPNVAYEIHVYDPESEYDRMIRRPSMTLPILVGEYAPSEYSSESDVRAMWELCQSLEIPHIAWTFHQRCPPNLLRDTASDGCGLAASTGYDFPRTSWGDMLYEYLRVAW